MLDCYQMDYKKAHITSCVSTGRKSRAGNVSNMNIIPWDTGWCKHNKFNTLECTESLFLL